MDFNGKFINTKKTLQRKVCQRAVCFTSVKAKEIIKEPRFQNPKQILIHVATNDMEQLSNGDCVNSICQVIDNASKQFPNSKIFYSNLLTRTDEHQSRVKTTNAAVYKEVEKLPNVHIINTSNIPAELLHDRKHLNKEGVIYKSYNIFFHFYTAFM